MISFEINESHLSDTTLEIKEWRNVQITKVELNLYNTLRETTFCAWRHVIFANVTLLCCVSHSNNMMSWLYIRSCLLCEITALQLITFATRSDTGSYNRLDLIQHVVPPHYVCNGYLSYYRHSWRLLLRSLVVLFWYSKSTISYTIYNLRERLYCNNNLHECL
jgi:hypothetical protein